MLYEFHFHQKRRGPCGGPLGIGNSDVQLHKGSMLAEPQTPTPGLLQTPVSTWEGRSGEPDVRQAVSSFSGCRTGRCQGFQKERKVRANSLPGQSPRREDHGESCTSHDPRPSGQRSQGETPGPHSPPWGETTDETLRAGVWAWGEGSMCSVSQRTPGSQQQGRS